MPGTSFPCFPHCCGFYFNFQTQFHLPRKRMIYGGISALSSTCGRILEPCSCTISHKSKVQTGSVGCKASLHILGGSDSTCVKSCFASLFLRHQNISCVLGVRRGFRIIKLGPPISLLSPTATFAAHLHKGVQSVRDLITHFLPWEASTQPKIESFVW